MMETVLGIDPGSRITGYGIVAFRKGTLQYLDSGFISVHELSMPERLQKIHQELARIVQQYQPNYTAIEKIFMAANPSSALKLGQARGAALVATGMKTVAEYSARQIKQAIVGYGNASKPQVEAMVTLLLNPRKKLQADEADALAIAICHAHMHTALTRILS